MDETNFSCYAITGSTHSANDNDPWILNLIDQIKIICSEQKKLLGICFGHQIISRALGGEISQSEKGWGIGPRTADLNDDGKGFFDLLYDRYLKLLDSEENDFDCRLIENGLSVHYSHQDQVVIPPPRSVLKCAGGNQHCPFAIAFHQPATHIGLDTDINIQSEILTFQGHPEFSSSFLLEIIRMLKDLGAYEREGRSSLGYDESLEEVEALVEKMSRDDRDRQHALHNSAIGKCIVAFFVS